MSRPSSAALLVGPTTPIGEAVLIRLGVMGVEVSAYLPDGDDGRTGEYACRLVHAPADIEQAADDGTWIIDCESQAPLAVVMRRGGETRRIAHAPLMGETIRKIEQAGWLDLWRDPWGGRALPLVHEVDVAAVVVDVVRYNRSAVVVAGPEPLPWRVVAQRVLAARGRTPLWRAVIGRWPASQYPASVLDEMTRAPVLGRRTLTEALTRRTAAAHRTVTRMGTALTVPSNP